MVETYPFEFFSREYFFTLFAKVKVRKSVIRSECVRRVYPHIAFFFFCFFYDTYYNITMASAFNVIQWFSNDILSQTFYRAKSVRYVSILFFFSIKIIRWILDVIEHCVISLEKVCFFGTPITLRRPTLTYLVTACHRAIFWSLWIANSKWCDSRRIDTQYRSSILPD